MHAFKIILFSLLVISILGTSCAHRGRLVQKYDVERENLLALVDKETPSNRTASLNMVESAKRAIEEGRYLFAQTQLETAIRVDGTNPYAYYYLAKTHYLIRNYKNALDMLTRSETLFGGTDPKWLSQCYVLEGMVYEDKGDREMAKSAYRAALEIYHRNPQAKLRLKELGK